ncbi:hypothetical protein [Amycolatopsis panacis]|uniref:Uncharacterized protein n=1 Tax=Amycolatopsis panacis TaxID=2340917 RepID=A0A419IBE3_9PSEU|nr:hypothetical protein [Amycolatopsis panacis]RJQ91280.1 hypothetical protein D5S19_02105 [Amycolatopsis panacis]
MSMPYGEKNGGYSYTPDALNGIVGQLHHGEQLLDRVAARAVTGVDAGFSSAGVGAALAGVIRMATAAAGALGGSASKVHAANGAYDDIENTHAGQLKLNDKRDSDPDTQRETHVHG